MREGNSNGKVVGENVPVEHVTDKLDLGFSGGDALRGRGLWAAHSKERHGWRMWVLLETADEEAGRCGIE